MVIRSSLLILCSISFLVPLFTFSLEICDCHIETCVSRRAVCSRTNSIPRFSFPRVARTKTREARSPRDSRVIYYLATVKTKFHRFSSFKGQPDDRVRARKQRVAESVGVSHLSKPDRRLHVSYNICISHLSQFNDDLILFSINRYPFLHDPLAILIIASRAFRVQR